jgi:hypothetical protein
MPPKPRRTPVSRRASAAPDPIPAGHVRVWSPTAGEVIVRLDDLEAGRLKALTQPTASEPPVRWDDVPGWDGNRPQGGGTRLPILPRSGLYLDGYGCGDEGRFCRLFADTWRRIALGARRLLMGYWRSDHPNVAICDFRGDHGRERLVVPRIQLLNGWHPPSFGLVRTGPPAPGRWPDLGSCYAEGFLFRFYAPVVDRLPDQLVRYLIAHELAHACQYAVGIGHRFAGVGAADVTDGMLEEDADLMASLWDCGESEDLDTWLADNGVTKRIRFDNYKDLFDAYDRQGRYASTAPAIP